MPSQAYTDWLAEFATSRIVLCELQPAETLGNWTLEAGTTNVYKRTFDNFIQASVVPGGVYRRLDKVRQDATDLTNRTSIALVDANLGSWYYDEAAKTIYISTTTGSDPDTFAAILAFFTIFVATDVKDFVGGRLYEPRIVGRVPEVRAKADDPLFGRKVFYQGDLELTNSDQFFDALVRAYTWKNKRVTFYFGGGSLAFSDYEQIAVMVIEDLASGDAVCRFTLRQMASLLQQRVPLNTYQASTFPRLGEGVEGTYRPLLYGRKDDIPAVLVDTVAGANLYEIADPGVQVLTAVHAVRAINRITQAVVTLTDGTHYATDLTNARITVTSTTYKWEDYAIRVDASGESDGAGGTLETCGEIIKDLLLALGETSGNLDASSFSQADTDTPFKLGIWIREGVPASEYITVIERSVFGSLFAARDGRWRFEVWDPTYDSTVAPKLKDEDFATWEPDDKIESIFWLARVKYDENPATGAWKEVTASQSRIKYEFETSDTMTLETVLRVAADATVMAQRYRFIAGTPTVEITFVERGLSLMTAEIFDKYLITRARAPSGSGLWTDEPVQILEVAKQLAPPRIQARVNDLWALGRSVGRWAASSAPDYAAATAEQRAHDGYWADSDGFVVPGDLTTKSISLWW